MKQTIRLKAPSTLDDLTCDDGEILNGQWLFADETEQNPPHDDGKTDDNFELLPTLEPIAAIPEDYELLLLHRTRNEHQVLNTILRKSNGEIAVFHPGSQLPPSYLASIVGDIKKTVSIGNFIVFLTSGGLEFALFDAETNDYIMLGKSLEPPTVGFAAEYTPLPPYSLADTDLPEFSLQIAIDSDNEKNVTDWLAGTGRTCPNELKIIIRDEIKEKFREFLKEASRAGLLFGKSEAKVAWRLATGCYWLSSNAVSFGDFDFVEAKIMTANCANGVLNLTLQLSNAPYRLKSTPNYSLPDGWNRFIDGAEVFIRSVSLTDTELYVSDALSLDAKSRGFRIDMFIPDGIGPFKGKDGESPDIADVRLPYGIIDNIFDTGDRLCALEFVAEPARNRLYLSDGGLPMVFRNITTVTGDKFRTIEASMRSHATSQSGHETAYALSDSGIYALSPTEQGLLEVQHISRDVALGYGSVVTLSDSLLVASPRGMVKIKGSTASLVAPLPDFIYDLPSFLTESLRAAYSYADNLLMLYLPDNERQAAERHKAAVLNLDTGEWWKSTVSISGHFGVWPGLFAIKERMLYQLKTFTKTPIISSLALYDAAIPTHTGSDMVEIATRPIKLGNPFTIKKLTMARALNPSGLPCQFAIYGALQNGRWHLLGRTDRGSMRLRGSGWRLFRITLDIPASLPANLPLFELTYQF